MRDRSRGRGPSHEEAESRATAPVIIKKYANRRLYNTETSSYITLEHLAAMTREGRDFKVVDAKTEDDITHNVLTQIIMEEEARGADDAAGQFPAPADLDVRRFDAGDGAGISRSVDGQLPPQPGAVQVGGRGRVRQLALRRDRQAQHGRCSKRRPRRSSRGGKPAPATPRTASKDDEIAALKAELARLQEKIEKLGK